MPLDAREHLSPRATLPPKSMFEKFEKEPRGHEGKNLCLPLFSQPSTAKVCSSGEDERWKLLGEIIFSKMGWCLPSKPVNSNLGWASSLPVYVLLLPPLCTLRAAWLVWTQQKQEMSSLNLHLSLQACFHPTILFVSLYGAETCFLSVSTCCCS